MKIDVFPALELPAEVLAAWSAAQAGSARLEELGYPVLYYENIDGGHAASANLAETARRQALEYVYLSKKLMD